VTVTTLTEEIITTSSSELTGTSFISSDAAVAQAITRALSRLSGVMHVEVKKVEVMIGGGGNIVGYRVTLQVHHAGEAAPGSDQEAGATRIWSRSYPPAEESSGGESSLPLGPLPVPIRADKEGVLRVGQTRVTLDAVVSAFRAGETAEGIAEQYPSLRLSDVYPVLSYYLDNREAVDGYIAQREDEARLLRKQIELDLDPTGLRARLLARRAGDR
jgi:uncharacterized protein (DUF433 family)/flavin-binding protein dodecin